MAKKNFFDQFDEPAEKPGRPGAKAKNFFDQFDEPARSGGNFFDQFDDPGEKPKQPAAKAGDYVAAVSNAVGEGVLNTQAALGTFVQAPIANVMSGAKGAVALADRGITAALNAAVPGSTVVNDEIQQDARDASRAAAAARAANVDAEGGSWANPATAAARIGLGLQEDARARIALVRADNQANNKPLMSQQQAVQDAEGFLPTLGAMAANPLATAYTLARSLPDMLVGMGVARAAAVQVAKGAGAAAETAAARAAAAGGDAAAQSAAATAAVEAIAKQATARASTAGTLSEAASSAYSAREGVYQEVMNLPDAKLAASPRYRQVLREVGGDRDKAREQLANELADQAPVLSGLGTAAGSAVARRTFGGDTTAELLAGKRASLKGMGKNILEESTEEGLQGVPEDLTQHGAVVQADPSKKFDLGGTLAQNMAAGALMGGGGTGAKLAWQTTNGGPSGAPAGGAEDARQPAQTAGTGATTPAAGPASTAATASTEARLAQLELAAQSRDLTPLERTEVDRLLVELARSEADTPLRSEPTDGTAGGPNDAAGAGSDAAASSAASAPRDFWSYARQQGYSPDSIEVGSPQWVQLRRQYVALRTGAPGSAAAAVATSTRPATAPAAPVAGAAADDSMSSSALQNRDRTRAASVAQMSEIARNPDYMRLGTSRTPEAGAPMVFAVGDDATKIPSQNLGRSDVAVMADGQRVSFRYAVVDAEDVEPSNFADGQPNAAFDSPVAGTLKALNNGRTAGVRAAHAMGTATAYVDELKADAASHGVALDAIERTRNPILVRVYSEQSNTADMAAKSQGQALGMSAPEMARQDASLIDSSALAVFAPGDVSSAANRDFVRAFVGKARQSGLDVAGLMTDDGSLSAAGRQRIQAALMQAAYSDGDLVAQMFESLDTDIKAIGEALKTVAGEWAGMRDAARTGAISPEVDITDNLLQALHLVRKARRDRDSLWELTRQPDLMTGEVPDPLTVGLIQVMYHGQYFTRPRSRDRVVQALRDYVRGAMVTTNGADLLGDSVTAADIVRAVNAHIETEGATDAQAQPPQGRDEPGGVPGAVGGSEEAGGRNEQLGAGQGSAGTGADRAVGAGGPGRAVGAGGEGVRPGAAADGLIAPTVPGAGQVESTDARRAAAVSRAKDALGEVAAILSQHTRASMLPEDSPGLMPALVKLFDAAIDVVGTDLQRATAWVKEQLRADPRTKAIWNWVSPDTYRKAARRALSERAGRESDSLIEGETKASVPMVERTIAPGNAGMPVAESPADARRIVAEASKGRPGIVFVDAQHRLTAWVPVDPAHMLELRADGRFDRLINSAANGGAGAALLANPNGMMNSRTVANIASALALADIRVLDSIDTVSMESAAERGLMPGASGTVLSRASAAKTASPSFRAWFGASKIVGGDGTPRVMYHGTARDITEFKGKQAGAIFLTDEPFFAQAYAETSDKWMRDRGESGGANILPVFVKAERPFDFDNADQRRAVIAKALELHGRRRPDGEISIHVEQKPSLWTAPVLESQLTDPAGNGNWLLIEEPWFQDAIKALGHDSFYVSESGFKNLGVYAPEQVKSAIGNRGTFDPTNADIRFSVAAGSATVSASARAGSIDVRALRQVADRVSKGLLGLPKVHVVSSPEALSSEGAQGRLREYIRERGAMADVEGALHEGEIYLFASGIADELRAEHVLAQHEAAHAGLRGMLGGDLTRTLRQIANNNAAVRKAATALMRDDAGLDLLQAVEEVIVDMPAQQLARLKGWRSVVGKVRDWLGAHGFERMAAQIDRWLAGTLAEQEQADLFVADLVREARAFVADGPGMRAAGLAFSRARRGDETVGGRRVPDPDPPQQSPWHKAKAAVRKLTDPDVIDRLIYETQDKLVDLKRLREHIQAIGGTITDLNDAYLGEELYHKRLAKRTEDFLSDELRPLLTELRAQGVSTEDFERFLHARHAPEANAVLAERNPNQAMLDELRAAARRQAQDLESQLAGARRRGSAIKAIEEALALARAESSRLKMAQAFRGTEAERLSLSGMSDDDAAALIAGLGAERRAALEGLAARVDAINARTLTLLERYGLMTGESLDAWRRTYQHYVPLHRDEAHVDSRSHPIGQGFSVKGDAARSRVGSNEKVTHILGHLAMQREAALTRGEKNHVVKQLYLMAAQNPDPNFWSLEKLPTIKTLDPATGFVRTGVDPKFKALPNVVMLRIAGRDVAITFNEHNPQALRLAEAMKNLDVGDLHVVLGLAAKATRWFASVNTQFNPIFGLINFARDLQEGMLNLSTTPIAGKQREVASNVLKAMRAIYRAERGKTATDVEWSRLWQEMQEVGGTTGYRDLYTDAADRTKALERELKALDRGEVSRAAHAVVDWLSDYNETMENAVRLSAYKVALDQGLTKPRAASLAKNLTVNFNRKGRQTREVGALYAFFNASMQGTSRMFETLRGPVGKRIMYGGVLLGAANTLLGMAVMGGGGGGDGGDDPWDRIPEFIKERSLIIPLGREDYMTLPMPLGFKVFPNIGRLAIEFAFGGSEKTAGRQIGKMLMTIADAFNPLGGAQDIGQMVAPTVIDPVVALMENKDWTGRPIYRENTNPLDPKPGHAMAKDSSSTPARVLAKAINAVTGGTEYRPGAWSPTPDQIDFVIGQLTGGLGRELLKVNQTLAAPITGDELPAYKIPLVGRLYGNTRGAAGQSERFYENVRLLNELENELQGRQRNHQDAEAFRKAEPLTSVIGKGNLAESRVHELRTQRRQVIERAEPGYRDRVRAIDEDIAQAMARLNAAVAKARHEDAAVN